MPNAGPTTGSAARPDDRLVRLGAESHTEQTVKGVVPWAVSLMLHVGLIAIGFLVTWTVVRMQDQPPAQVVADFFSAQYDPATSVTTTQPATPQSTKVESLHARELEKNVTEQLASLGTDPLRQLADVANQGAPAGFGSHDALTGFAPQPGGQGQASFIGVRSTNARKIAYVIDASGSMIRSLPIVVEELQRSLDGLSPQQDFAVVFFQKNEAVVVPPGRLVPAEAQNRTSAIKWIKSKVIPGGRSSPLDALEAALKMEPDAIFLLSENITGSGEFEIDQKDLLAVLEKLNPRDASTGRRRTQINCIQFLSPDPLDTLRKIAEAHGGPNGYKYLDRAELGLGGS